MYVFVYLRISSPCPAPQVSTANARSAFGFRLCSCWVALLV